MGLTFALASFACVGPFMGSLLAASIQGDKLQPLMGMASFRGRVGVAVLLPGAVPVVAGTDAEGGRMDVAREGGAGLRAAGGDIEIPE